MSTYTITPPYTTSFAVEPSLSNQDFATVIAFDEHTWMIIVDGHGKHRLPLPPNTSDLVTWLKGYEWKTLIETCSTVVSSQTINPIDIVIADMDKTYTSTAGIGATISMACVSPTDVKMWWRGDSLIKLYEDGSMVASTYNVNILDNCEKERLNVQGIKYNIEHSHQIKALNDTQMTMVYNPYCIFSPRTCTIRDKINMTQALGHDNVCGTCDNFLSYRFLEGKNYKLVGGTDGLWDVMSDTTNDLLWMSSQITDAKQIVRKAVERWQQPWEYVYSGSMEVLIDRDDVSAATIHILNSL